jgi:hypothetical protein
MMILNFKPKKRPAPLVLSRSGDTITVNGETFDFSPLPDGATLPREAIGSDWFVGPVERIDGVLHVTLMLPFAPGAPEETRFPAPITLTGDGPVSLPPFSAEEAENAAD